VDSLQTAQPATAPLQQTVPCPRCGSKLVSPESLGWCPKCGYCRSLEEDAAKVALIKPPVHKPSPLGAVEFVEALRKVPFWVWVIAGGAAAVALSALVANLVLPAGENFPRALISSIFTALGLFGLWLARAWALILIAPTDDSVGMKDLFLPSKLWIIAFRRLPETKKPIGLLCWSMALSICASSIIGGMMFWTSYYQPKKLANKNLMASVMGAMQGEGKEESLEEAIRDFASSQDLTKGKGDKKLVEDDPTKPDTRPTMQCVVLGYRLTKKKELTGLVLASDFNGRLKYIGLVETGWTKEQAAELLQRLEPLQQERPLIAGLGLIANWVQPKVFCEVHQSGLSDQGRLIKPRFGNLLTE
jgi:hypothetical protein